MADDEFEGIDKSQFGDVLKNMQNEIKDKVITKLLTKLELQSKENENLKKENQMLKSHLAYILKRIIINRYELGNNNGGNSNYGRNSSTFGRNGSNINMGKAIHNSVILKENKGSNQSLRPLKSVENYRCATEGNIFSEPEYINKNKDKNSINMDNKVNSYLNSLYRNNFKTNDNGLSNDFFLNKKESLFDELFTNKEKNNNNNLNNNNHGNRNLSSTGSQRNVGNSVGKRIGNRKSNKGSASKINYNKNYPNSNYRTKIRGSNNLNMSDISNSNRPIKNSSYISNPNLNTENKNYGTNTVKPKQGNKNYGVEKTKSKKDYASIKRSPFLANKF